MLKPRDQVQSAINEITLNLWFPLGVKLLVHLDFFGSIGIGDGQRYYFWFGVWPIRPQILSPTILLLIIF